MLGGSRGDSLRVAPAVLVIVLLASGCTEETSEAPEVARPVKLLTLNAGGGGSVVELPGKIQAAQTSEMAFEVPGKIIEFPIKQGERVEKGTLLARLDPRDYEARLDSARARVEQAKADYDRNLQLYKADVVAPAELERHKRHYEVVKASLAEAEKGVEDTILRAPFDGVMARKLVEDFQNVQAKQPVLTFVDDSALELAVNVPEALVAGGKPGRTVDEITESIHPAVVVSAIPDREFPARVKEIAATADPQTRTFEAVVVFDNPEDVAVLPGMTARLVATRRSRDPAGGFTIPSGAVVADESGSAFVWLVDRDSMRVQKRPVVIGELTGSEIEVREGLAAGDTIATSGVQQLRDGMLVRPFES